VKKSISKLLEEARSREQARINISLGAMNAVHDAPNGKLNLTALLDQAVAETKWYSLKEIAKKHGLLYSTVHHQLKGKPGFTRFGRTIRVAEFLYRSWLESSVRDGLRP